MPVTIDELLGWPVGELSASAARLTELAASIRSQAGRIQAPSGSSFEGSAAKGATIQAESLKRSYLAYSDNLQSAAAEVHSAAQRISHVQQLLRAAKASVAASGYPGFQLTPNGDLYKPRPPDLALSEDGNELVKYDEALATGNRAAASARVALAQGEAADRSLASGLASVFGTSLPQDAMSLSWPEIQKVAGVIGAGFMNFTVGVVNNSIGALIEGAQFFWKTKFQMLLHPIVYLENSAIFYAGLVNAGTLLIDDPKEFGKTMTGWDPNNKAGWAGGVVGTALLAIPTKGASAFAKAGAVTALKSAAKGTATNSTKTVTKQVLKNGPSSTYGAFKTNAQAATQAAKTGSISGTGFTYANAKPYLANPEKVIKDLAKTTTFKVSLAQGTVETAFVATVDEDQVRAVGQEGKEIVDDAIDLAKNTVRKATKPVSGSW